MIKVYMTILPGVLACLPAFISGVFYGYTLKSAGKGELKNKIWGGRIRLETVLAAGLSLFALLALAILLLSITEVRVV